MESIFECIVNNRSIKTSANPGIVVLDFLRQNEHLTGTKEGCREGDCGACTILIGELHGNEVLYKAVNSCLLPLGDADGKHIVTVEGINQPRELNPIQHAFVEEGGTQCGFCTPGFVLSLSGYVINNPVLEVEEAINAVGGNICRCTGHPPIKKAIRHIVEQYQQKNNTTVANLVEQKILPEYFLSISSRLKEIQKRTQANISIEGSSSRVVSGGTDLYVQNAFILHNETTQRISSWQKKETISQDEEAIHIPGTTTVEEFRLSPIVLKYFPEFKKQLELFGSTPIRNRATIAGNIVNASPIGDMTNILMALDAMLTLRDGSSMRTLPLRKFYLGYKQIDKKKNELIEMFSFPIPNSAAKFNFEKVSRRQYLDIASVNSSMIFSLNGDHIFNVGISAGGVGPIPLYLAKTSEFLDEKSMNADILNQAFAIAQTEISPISDARGSAPYKRLLLRQLIAAHFMKYFPDAVKKGSLV